MRVNNISVFRIVCFIFALLSISVNVKANEPSVERVLWKKRPIPFHLSIGQERLAHFPSDIRYWIPTSLDDSVSILAVNGVLYITAHQAFDKTRIRVQELASQKVYLLDVSASKDVLTHSELIVMNPERNENKSSENGSDELVFDWFVRLTRFAAQSLYAQERLMPSSDDIRPVRINSKDAVYLVRGGDIEAIPIQSWRGGGYYVTAVRIRNLSSDEVHIKHRASTAIRLIQRTIILDNDIRGDWLAVTPQHTTLKPAGQDDVTTLYLLSSRTFTESF